METAKLVIHFRLFFGEDGIQLAHVTMAVKKKILGI